MIPRRAAKQQIRQLSNSLTILFQSVDLVEDMRPFQSEVRTVTKELMPRVWTDERFRGVFSEGCCTLQHLLWPSSNLSSLSDICRIRFHHGRICDGELPVVSELTTENREARNVPAHTTTRIFTRDLLPTGRPIDRKA